MGDRKPKKTSSGSGDAFKAKQVKSNANRAPEAPKGDVAPKSKEEVSLYAAWTSIHAAKALTIEAKNFSVPSSFTRPTLIEQLRYSTNISFWLLHGWHIQKY